MQVRPIQDSDRDWVLQTSQGFWASERMVVHGTVFQLDALPGFIAWRDQERCGLVCFDFRTRECEVVALASLTPGKGVGTVLLEAAGLAARLAGCERMVLFTTNDNMEALRFFQRRGFLLVAVHRLAVERARRLKPEIPQVGFHGIPLRDEIELEIQFERQD